MERRTRVIGDQLLVEGEVVGVLKSGLAASLYQNLLDTLDGLVVDDYQGNCSVTTELDEYEERAVDTLKWWRDYLRKKRKQTAEMYNQLTEAISEARASNNKAVNQLRAVGEDRDRLREAADAEFSRLQGELGRQATMYCELLEKAKIALRERDEARAWAENAVKKSFEQGRSAGYAEGTRHQRSRTMYANNDMGQ